MKRISSLELARLIANNHSHTEIATMLGVTTSAITQAAGEADVQQLVEDFGVRSEAAIFDDRYDSLEARAAQILEKKLATEGTSLKIRELAHTVQLLNGLKRRTGLHKSNPVTGEGAIVQINMPVRITKQLIVMSPQKEILEIDGRQMETIQPKNLNSLITATPALAADLL